jgi:hypothetical protein
MGTTSKAIDNYYITTLLAYRLLTPSALAEKSNNSHHHHVHEGLGVFPVP